MMLSPTAHLVLIGVSILVSLASIVISVLTMRFNRAEHAEDRPPLPGRTLYTGSILAGDWHSAPPFITLSDGREYDRNDDEY